VGHPVLKLKRTQYGWVRLGSLKAGEARELTAEEVRRLGGRPKRGPVAVIH